MEKVERKNRFVTISYSSIAPLPVALMFQQYFFSISTKNMRTLINMKMYSDLNEGKLRVWCLLNQDSLILQRC